MYDDELLGNLVKLSSIIAIHSGHNNIAGLRVIVVYVIISKSLLSKVMIKNKFLFL